jgi:hypothetical protein
MPRKLAMNQFPGKVGAPDDPSVFHLGVPGVKPPRITYSLEPPLSEARATVTSKASLDLIS